MKIIKATLSWNFRKSLGLLWALWHMAFPTLTTHGSIEKQSKQITEND